MEPNHDRKKEHREITYQVGWKKGKIQWNDQGNPLAGGTLQGANGSHLLWRLQLRYAWRQAPVLSQAMVMPLLYALPVASFLLTAVLIYSLTHS